MCDVLGKVQFEVTREHAACSSKNQEGKLGPGDTARKLELSLLPLWVVHPAHLKYLICTCQTVMVASTLVR